MERVALEYAERITTTGQKVDDTLFSELKKHFFGAEDHRVRADGGHRHGELPLEVQSRRLVSRPKASAWCQRGRWPT